MFLVSFSKPKNKERYLMRNKHKSILKDGIGFLRFRYNFIISGTFIFFALIDKYIILEACHRLPKTFVKFLSRVFSYSQECGEIESAGQYCIF